jgi:hypothetical protein
MKTIFKIAIASSSTVALIVGGLILRAGGWENFKLQNFHLTQHFHDQSQELGDLRKQNANPEKNSRINLDQLKNGGPPKDGIPSVDNPKFDTAETTPFDKEEKVIGVVVNGEAKAYPYGILNWHEIVNDSIGGTNVSVTYCPLCDTAVVVERGDTTFGVSGKLYQSCLVMYDRSDDSLFAQPWALGVVGPQVNETLPRVPAVKTTLGAWLEKHPDSKILSTDTGYQRAYQEYPYGSYYTDSRLIFPVRNQDQRDQHPKELISYIWQSSSATPHNEFAGDSHKFVHQNMKEIGQKEVQLGDRTVIARWDEQLQTVIVEDRQGNRIPTSPAFAFVYPAFFGNSQ